MPDLARLYEHACDRSRAAADAMELGAAAVSLGLGPVNLRWIMIHIDETARPHGSPRLLRDALGGQEDFTSAQAQSEPMTVVL